MEKLQEGSAPFNMALATLERVNNILREITEISVGEYGGNIQCFYAKLKLVKQLFLASIPLIDNKEEKDKLQKEIFKLNQMFGVKYDARSQKRRLTCYKEIDTELDYVIIKIQEVLQKEKYFMPPKNDPRFSWKQ